MSFWNHQLQGWIHSTSGHTHSIHITTRTRSNHTNPHTTCNRPTVGFSRPGLILFWPLFETLATIATNLDNRESSDPCQTSIFAHHFQLRKYVCKPRQLQFLDKGRLSQIYPRCFSFFLEFFICFFILWCSNLCFPVGDWPLLVLISLAGLLVMGNEGSAPSSEESTPISECPSIYSTHSRVRSSVESTRAPSPMEAPEPDLSHLTAEEISQIRSVMDRARDLQQDEATRAR